MWRFYQPELSLLVISNPNKMTGVKTCFDTIIFVLIIVVLRLMLICYDENTIILLLLYTSEWKGIYIIYY